MKINRTKNAARNIVYGGIYRVYQIVVPFLMRTAMIYFMGVQYLGLNSLFTSILQVLNLAELGVGSAMVYSMYKPVAEDNIEEICSLMRLYRFYYRIIGLVIGILGILILPFLPYLIEGDIPQDINIYIIYLLNLGSTVLSYWLFAYRNCLLNAYQRGDIINKIMIATSTVQYALQLFVLCFLQNYYLYLIVLLVMQAANNIITAVVTMKMFPEYKPGKKLQHDTVSKINKRIRDLFTAKVGGVVVNSVDTIVISAFLGLEMLAIYQNYFYILNSVMGFITVIFSACTAGIGNSLIIESKEKNFDDLKKFTFIIFWISGFCTCCFLSLFQPFMRLWVGDSLMLGYAAVICLSIYFFIMEINSLLNLYKDAAGIWHKDRFRPLATAMANLCMNLVMVQFWGIYGIILSTVLSALIVGMPWLLNNLFSTLFERKYLNAYLKMLGFYVVVSVIVCCITTLLCNIIKFNEIGTLAMRAVICCVLPNLLFLGIYHNKSEFKESVKLIDRMTNHKFHFLFCHLV